jgi:small basic protein
MPESKETPKDTKVEMSPWAIVSLVFGIIVGLVWHLGAASLSYAKYGSIGWAILDFFFATLYYPYYALVLNTPPTPTMFGGRRLRLPKLF